MISFEQLISNIRDLNLQCVKVTDMSKNRIFDFIDCEETEETISALQARKNMFESFGMIQAKCTTLSGKVGGWKDPYVYKVSFNQMALATTDNPSKHHSGYVSAKEAELMAKLAGLELEMRFKNQLDDMKRQMEAIQSQDLLSNFQKFLPLAPIFIKDQNVLNNMAGMAQAMNGAPQNRPQGMAGTNQIHMAKTPQEIDEQAKNIQIKLQQLIESPAIGIDKIEKLVNALHASPALIDKALLFI